MARRHQFPTPRCLSGDRLVGLMPPAFIHALSCRIREAIVTRRRRIRLGPPKSNLDRHDDALVCGAALPRAGKESRRSETAETNGLKYPRPGTHLHTVGVIGSSPLAPTNSPAKRAEDRTAR